MLYSLTLFSNEYDQAQDNKSCAWSYSKLHQGSPFDDLFGLMSTVLSVWLLCRADLALFTSDALRYTNKGTEYLEMTIFTSLDLPIANLLLRDYYFKHGL